MKLALAIAAMASGAMAIDTTYMSIGNWSNVAFTVSGSGPSDPSTPVITADSTLTFDATSDPMTLEYNFYLDTDDLALDGYNAAVRKSGSYNTLIYGDWMMPETPVPDFWPEGEYEVLFAAQDIFGNIKTDMETFAYPNTGKADISPPTCTGVPAISGTVTTAAGGDVTVTGFSDMTFDCTEVGTTAWIGLAFETADGMYTTTSGLTQYCTETDSNGTYTYSCSLTQAEVQAVAESSVSEWPTQTLKTYVEITDEVDQSNQYGSGSVSLVNNNYPTLAAPECSSFSISSWENEELCLEATCQSNSVMQDGGDVPLAGIQAVFDCPSGECYSYIKVELGCNGNDCTGCTQFPVNGFNNGDYSLRSFAVSDMYEATTVYGPEVKFCNFVAREFGLYIPFADPADLGSYDSLCGGFNPADPSTYCPSSLTATECVQYRDDLNSLLERSSASVAVPALLAVIAPLLVLFNQA